VIKPNDGTVWFAILVSSAGIEESARQRKQAGLDAGRPQSVHEGKAGSIDHEYFAGSIGLLNAVASNAVCEVGHVSAVLSNTHAPVLGRNRS
jgi:hypothetical protein